jgi:galactose mutarotase-like enzyme
MMAHHTLSNAYLSATVRVDGAELCSLRDAGGQELLWSASPPWPRHAPILFPIVGRLNGDTLRHDGREYRMTQHGFARDRRFAWLGHTGTTCRLVLHDDAQTRALYPFAFRFEVGYALDDDALEVTFTITNTGRVVLPASAGAHPAFRWPLAEGVAKEAHRLEFSDAETAPIRRLTGGLILPEAQPSPVQGRTLPLDPALFDPDAIIMDHPASSSVRYGGTGTPTLEVSWQGFRQLGVWSRRDCDLLCIEPWHGHADPEGFTGDVMDKPGMMLIAPGDRRVLVHRIRVC